MESIVEASVELVELECGVKSELRHNPYSTPQSHPHSIFLNSKLSENHFVADHSVVSRKS